MRLPKIGDLVTTDQALELCLEFKLDYLADRIKADPAPYHPWVFDGCSGLPDQLLDFFTGCHWKDITYKCCLPHDLAYAYGEPSNEDERREVDLKFCNDLITQAGMTEGLAHAFLAAVRVAGHEALPFSFAWCFARTKLGGN